MRDPYELLGVARNAPAKDIKAAYRKLAKKYHPDQNPNDPKAKENFAAATQAYEILGDEKNRGAFDRGEIDAEGKPRFQGFGAGGPGDPFSSFRHTRQRGQGPGGMRFEFRSSGPGGDAFGADDILSEIFGGGAGPRGGPGMGSRRASAGRDVNLAVDVTVEEAASAANVTAFFPDGRHISVKLPRYVEDGQTIRLKGQGERGIGGAGDALVKIRLRRHPLYRVEGRDLYVDLPVPLRDAVLGTKIAVETPAGRVAVNVPAWSGSDKVLRIKGRGLPRKESGNGDLYARVQVMLPQEDHDLEALMKSKS